VSGREQEKRTFVGSFFEGKESLPRGSKRARIVFPPKKKKMKTEKGRGNKSEWFRRAIFREISFIFTKRNGVGAKMREQIRKGNVLILGEATKEKGEEPSEVISQGERREAELRGKRERLQTTTKIVSHGGKLRRSLSKKERRRERFRL